MLVFWRAGLYAPRELREGAGRIVPSVFLVAALALAFAIGTGQHFTTFGLYVVGAVFVAVLIGFFRASYEMRHRHRCCAPSACAARSCSSATPSRARICATSLGARRGGIILRLRRRDRARVRRRGRARASPLDELIVADSGLDEQRLLEIVEAAHRRGVKVRVAPRTTELLIERGEYVPGQGVPLFELRPPIFAGAQWATKRVFDLVVGALIVVRRAAPLAAHRARDQAHVARARALRRSARRARRAASSGCSSSARWSRAPTARQAALEQRTRPAARSSRSATTRA